MTDHGLPIGSAPTARLTIAGRQLPLAPNAGNGKISQPRNHGHLSSRFRRRNHHCRGAARKARRSPVRLNPQPPDRQFLFSSPKYRWMQDGGRSGAYRLLGARGWVFQLIKLEVIGDENTLFPDNEGSLHATRILAKEGFVVLPYTTDDLINARKLIDAGAAAVMPLGAPIGSGLGIQNQTNLRILRERITSVPLIVDAGLGTASDAAIAMELGYDAVLLNTAVAGARGSVAMACAMRHAVIAGRLAFEAGRMGRFLYANPSSPEGWLE
jgi:thiazole synthase